MRPLVLLAALVLLLGTSCQALLDSQEAYEFRGCTESTAGCPNDGTYRCALDTIRARHDACVAATDCVMVEFGDCVSSHACRPVSVHRDREAAWRAEAEAERDRYCRTASCQALADCAAGSFKVECVAGRCTTTEVQGTP